MKRIICPFHQERTPSCVLYKEIFICFGCGKRGPLSELTGVDTTQANDPEPEDLKESLSYIDTLPLKSIRGLELPADDISYFIVWPDRNYYKRRFIDPKGSKYIGASGHTKPIFNANKVGSTTLVIVEGELNALSIAKAIPEIDVCSPGGSGDFKSSQMKKYCTSTTVYSTILVLADKDKAGAFACIDLMSQLQGKVRHLHAELMATDANEMLTGQGLETLRKEITRILERSLAASLV